MNAFKQAWQCVALKFEMKWTV